MSADSTLESHITSEELAAYLDRRLGASASARIESHMADCGECRGDLVEARSLLATTIAPAFSLSGGRASRTRVWFAAAGLVALACLPLLRRAVPSPGVTPSLRAARTLQPRVEIIAPDNRLVDAATIVFMWRSVERASTYRLTLTDSSATPLFAMVTTDTTATTPSGIQLRRGTSYLWYVDALTSDGHTLSSGIRLLSTSR